MIIPEKSVEDWASDIIHQCTPDNMDRIQRGAFYRNLYLAADENGDTAIFNKTFDSIEDLTSYLCSSTDLRYLVNFPGGGSSLQRAQADAIAHELLDQSRHTDLDTLYEEATRWALIKGISFIKMLWSVNGLEPHIVFPEYMGVMRADLNSLDDQEAFVHSTYLTRDQFKILIKDHPDAKRIYKRAIQFSAQTRSADAPDQGAMLKQVIVGGFQPYQGVGGVGAANPQTTNGLVQWLAGPYPGFDPRVITELVRVDELWVKDDDRADDEGRREWSTFQVVGNIMLFGKEQRMNIFADSIDPSNRSHMRKPFEANPLAFKHPFIEFCPNRLQNYFWGRSEIANLALLQRQLNKRINGINGLLRLQENPPISFMGGTMMDQDKKSKLTKPGGWMHDPDPTAKPPQVLAPVLPPDLWTSLEQTERLFDVMTGMTPTLQGMASPSVRSQGQTGQLTTNATPRLRTKSIRIERSIQTCAGLLLDLLKAKSKNLITAWVIPGPDLNKAIMGRLIDPSVEPPAPGMKAYQFYMHEVPDDVRVMVDAHSSSPAFGDASVQKAILLKKANAMSDIQFIEQVNPPNADVVIAEAKTAEVLQQAQQAAQAAAQQQQGGPPPGKHGKK
jgi:hypothetical protein